MHDLNGISTTFAVKIAARLPPSDTPLNHPMPDLEATCMHNKYAVTNRYMRPSLQGDERSSRGHKRASPMVHDIATSRCSGELPAAGRAS